MTPPILALVLAPPALAGAGVVEVYRCPATAALVLVLDREHPEGGAQAVEADRCMLSERIPTPEKENKP